MPLLRVTIALALLAAIVYALVATGVHVVFDYKDQLVANSFVVGEAQTERRTVEVGGAQAVDVEILEGFGELDVHGGSPDLLSAKLTYNVQELRPQVTYRVEDSQGKLVIQHPEITDFYRMFNFSKYRSQWDLAFDDDIPLHLIIAVGAGESRLNLAGLHLTGGEINVGTGATTVDLSGAWRRSFALRVDGGLGETNLRLPADTGVRVVVDAGIGAVEAHGLTQKEEGEYVNDAYGHSAETIEIEVNAGIGAVNLVVE